MPSFKEVIVGLAKEYGLKQTSVDSMYKTILFISGCTETDPIDSINKGLLTNYKRKLKMLSPRTKSSYLSHFRKFLKCQGIEDDDLVDEYRNAYREKSKQLPEKEETITWPDIIKRRDEMLRDFNKTELSGKNSRFGRTNDLKDLIIACLFTYIPPLRLNEWLNCELHEKLKNEEIQKKLLNTNLCVLKDKTFYISHYKTDKQYGAREIQLPDELINVLRKWRTLIEDDTLLAMAKGTLIKHLQRLFGVSSRSLRHIYISYKVPSLTLAERKDLANLMGHSFNMQATTYMTTPTVETPKDNWQTPRRIDTKLQNSKKMAKTTQAAKMPRKPLKV